MEAVLSGWMTFLKGTKMKSILSWILHTYSCTKFLYQTEMQMIKTNILISWNFMWIFAEPWFHTGWAIFQTKHCFNLPDWCGYLADIIRGYESPCICSQDNMVQKYEILRVLKFTFMIDHSKSLIFKKHFKFQLEFDQYARAY